MGSVPTPPSPPNAPGDCVLAAAAPRPARQSLSTLWTKPGGVASMPLCQDPGQSPAPRGQRPRSGSETSRRTPSRSWHGPSSRPRRRTRRRAPTTPASSCARVYDLGPISRAEIARLTGLTRTSVGELVGELEQEGLAQEVGRGPSTGGKQPTLVSLVDDARHVVTLDLGERTFTAALARPARRGPRADQQGPRRHGRRRGPRPRPRPHRRDPGPPAPADPRHRRRHPGHRRRATARSAGRSTCPGPTCRSARSSPTATTSRRSSPTTAAPRPSRPSCSVATSGPTTWSRSRSGAASAPASSSTASCSAATATAPARSAMSSSSPTAPSATAAASAASRPSPAPRRSCATPRAAGPRTRRHSPSWPPRPPPATRPRWPSRAPPAGRSARPSPT